MTGSSGSSGLFGGDSHPYKFSTTVTDSDPGSGYLRFNNSTYTDVTNIFIDINFIYLGQA